MDGKSLQDNSSPASTQAGNNKMVLINPATGKPLKPPKPPEKPLMPYMRYSRKVWDQVKAGHKDSKLWEIGRIIGQMWRELSTEEKTKYNHEWEIEKLEYAKAMEVYQNSPTYQQYLVAKEKAAALAGLPPSTELSQSGTVVQPAGGQHQQQIATAGGNGRSATPQTAVGNGAGSQLPAKGAATAGGQPSQLAGHPTPAAQQIGSSVPLPTSSYPKPASNSSTANSGGRSTAANHQQQQHNAGLSLVDDGRLSTAQADADYCHQPAKVTAAHARFDRNQRLLSDLLSEVCVPDARTMVTVPRLQMLKRQAHSLAQHQKKLEAELALLEDRYQAKRQKVDESRLAFQTKLNEACKPVVDDAKYAQMLAKAQIDLMAEYEAHLKEQAAKTASVEKGAMNSKTK